MIGHHAHRSSKWRWARVLVVFVALVASTAIAYGAPEDDEAPSRLESVSDDAEAPASTDPAAANSSAEPEAADLPGPDPAARRWETVVTAEPSFPDAVVVSGTDLRHEPVVNVGEVLVGLPGVAATRRAESAAAPVIRGIGGERVRTRVGGVPVYGACPSQMDPAITYFGPSSVDRVTLTRGIPSVTSGPVGLGGAIDVSIDYERDPGAEPELTPFAGGFFDVARGGGGFGAGLRGGGRRVDFRGETRWLELGDYRSGNDARVPAGVQHLEATYSVGLRPWDRHRFRQAFLAVHDRDIEYPALPMDNRHTSFWVYDAGYRIAFPDGALERLDVRGGFSLVDHVMDNQDKANWAMLDARTSSSSNTFSSGASADFRLGGESTLTAGADVSSLWRDGTRTRLVRATGATFEDHIWPDAAQHDLGVFAEAVWMLHPDWRLRTGARGDLVSTDATAVDEPGLGGQPIRSHYVRFYGDSAGETDRTEPMGSVQALLEWRPFDEVVAHAGTGLSMQAAGITERYFAFGPAPGGFQVGNPALSAEKKWAAEVGARSTGRRVSFGGDAFFAWAGDWVLQTRIDEVDVDGDGVDDLVRGFRNADARFAGFEVFVEPRPVAHFSFPIAVSHVRARNVSDGRPLPEIPPLQGTAAARLEYGETLRWWAEVGTRLVTRQTSVDRLFPEDETPAFAILRAEVGVSLGERLHSRAGVENLLDAEYHEHLTREAVGPTGDLAAGDEVPSPGRRLFVSVWGEL